MPVKLYKFLIIPGVIILILLFWLYVINVKKQDNLKVSFLDVGQGDSALIQSPHGQNVLIDGGPDDSVIYGLSKNLPWWERTIDLVILTHPHDDHVSGLVDVLKRYHVKQVAYTGVAHNSPNYLAWLKLVRDKKIPMYIIDEPRKIVLGDDCVLEILYPLDDLLNKEVDNLNNSSVVSRLVYKNVKFLFTGDMEKIIEEQLLTSKADLKSHVMKIAHHGSDTSSAEAFLRNINPDIAVISVGKDNKFNHPNGRVLNRLERLSIRVLRTDLDGDVNFVSNGVKIYKK